MSEARKYVIEAISEIARVRTNLTAYQVQLQDAAESWLQELAMRLTKDDQGEDTPRVLRELSSVVQLLLPQCCNDERTNPLFGKALSLLIQVERKQGGSERLMRRLLDAQLAERCALDGRRVLVLNPGFTGTTVCWFEGLCKVHAARAHNQPGAPDTLERRLQFIQALLSRWGVDAKTLDGIACRCGFVKPVPTGTYRVVPEMLQDLIEVRQDHADSLGIPLALNLIERLGLKQPMLITTTDPIISDEVEILDRVTGLVDLKRQGMAAHYLNHKAMWKVLASLIGKEREDLDMVTGHLGSAMSFARHRRGQVTAVVDTLSGTPSSCGCGPVDPRLLIEANKSEGFSWKNLQQAVYNRGGLLSLAGTDDFGALLGFRQHGASEEQKSKIELVLDFFSRKIASALLRLTADGKPVSLLAFTGGLTGMPELTGRVEASLAARYPIVWVEGTLVDEALASGCIRGLYQPEGLKDYATERDVYRQKRSEENRLLDTKIFEREVYYRKKGAPITSLAELIDAAGLAVREGFVPRVAIVGADNEEAILAAKRANAEGRYHIAKFDLVGDHRAINEIAYEYDLVIDDDNYAIVDSDTPTADAIRLLEANRVHVLMKGSLKTEVILRDVLRYLKSKGRLKPGQLVSHVVVMEIPGRGKMTLISDAGVNPAPDEEKRRKIIENALIVARSLHLHMPKVAVMSAVEKTNASIDSSVEAERIASHFTERTDCIVEGPLSFDVAMEPAAAREKHYPGKIQGDADILIMPDIDAGNMLYKALITQSGATAAGVILCGDMPLILTSRSDSARSKLASIALSVQMYFEVFQHQKAEAEPSGQCLSPVIGTS